MCEAGNRVMQCFHCNWSKQIEVIGCFALFSHCWNRLSMYLIFKELELLDKNKLPDLIFLH